MSNVLNQINELHRLGCMLDFSCTARYTYDELTELKLWAIRIDYTDKDSDTCLQIRKQGRDFELAFTAAYDEFHKSARQGLPIPLLAPREKSAIEGHGENIVNQADDYNKKTW